MEMEEKFSGRSRGKFQQDQILFTIRGWAPQLLILSHPAVGGFLTHGGWNSTLEGICSGVPLITWPLFEDQFCNEKVVVQVAKTGVNIGVKQPLTFGEEEKIGVLVNKGAVESAVDELMDGGEEGEQRRKRAKALAVAPLVAKGLMLSVCKISHGLKIDLDRNS